MDSRGVHFSTTKCESSCTDCFVHHGGASQSGCLMPVKSRPALLQCCPRPSGITSSFVLLFPPCSFLIIRQTQIYLSQPFLRNVLTQRNRGYQGGVTDKGEINNLCTEEYLQASKPETETFAVPDGTSWTIKYCGIFDRDHDIPCMHL